jgi:hypothetical protein
MQACTKLTLFGAINKIPRLCAIDTGCWRVSTEGNISCSLYKLPDLCVLLKSAHPRKNKRGILPQASYLGKGAHAWKASVFLWRY